MKLAPISKCSECTFFCQMKATTNKNSKLIPWCMKKRGAMLTNPGKENDFPSWCPLDDLKIDIADMEG